MGHSGPAAQPSPPPYSRTMESLLIGLLAFMPFAFGVVEPWSEQVMFILCAAIWTTFAVGVMRAGGERPRWHWTYVPILALLLIAALQWIPLPTGLVRILSPGTVEARRQLLGDVPELHAHLRTTSLSFYRGATGHDLRLVFAVATVFFVVANGYRRPAQIRRLLAAISLIGAAVVLVCLAQDLFGSGKIYGFVPTGKATANSGPFVHHSHYAQFLNLSMGAALGWMLILLREDWQGRSLVASEVADYLATPRGKLVLAIAALLTLGAITIFLSLSRGGMISMLAAAAFTAAALSLRHSPKGCNWALVALALLVFTGVLYLGFDAVYDRLATLENFHEAQSGRMQILRDVAIAWARFPAWGVGLGTHAVVYPMFGRATTPALASHAENEYAQAAEEMGALGLIALIAFGTLVWASYARIVRRPREPIGYAAYGIGFGLLAILIHSLSDFGQHLPANAMLSAVFCALLIGLDSPGPSPRPCHAVATSPQIVRPRWAVLAVLACSGGIWLGILFQADRSRRAEAHWARASAVEKHMTDVDWQESDAAYADLITHASRASALEPSNIQYRHWLNVYRWRSISRATDLHGRAVLHEGAVESTRRIARELRETILLCPTFGPTWCVLGQLEYGVLDRDRGLDHLRKSIALSPNDPTVCLVTGLTDIDCGRARDGLAKLRRAVQLDTRLYPDVARACIYDLRSADAAIELAEGQTHRLGQLAGILAEAGEEEGLALEVQRRLVDLLASRCNDPQAPASCFAALGWMREKQHDIGAAVQCFREALARDYGQVSYHLALARLLAQTERLAEAAHEARVCLRLRPQYAPAETLIAELSIRTADPMDTAAREKTGSP